MASSKKPVMLTLKRSILIYQRSDYIWGSSERWGRFQQVKRMRNREEMLTACYQGMVGNWAWWKHGAYFMVRDMARKSCSSRWWETSYSPRGQILPARQGRSLLKETDERSWYFVCTEWITKKEPIRNDISDEVKEKEIRTWQLKVLYSLVRKSWSQQPLTQIIESE